MTSFGITQEEQARQENVQYGASEDDEEPLLFEQEEQALEARATRNREELEDMKRRLDEFKAALKESLNVIQLDYGALDILEPVKA